MIRYYTPYLLVIKSGYWLNKSLKLKFRLSNFREVKRTICGRSSVNPTPKVGDGPPNPAKGLGVVYQIKKMKNSRGFLGFNPLKIPGGQELAP
jgi:hypothetical protein